MAYDFSGLSPADFEDLARDLIGRDLGLRFEAFAAGPDGGIDGRHSTATAMGRKVVTILQAKHYVQSGLANLRSVMRRERAAIDRLAPQRYILATSRALTPSNKRDLASIVGPALRQESDIYASGDFNALLRRFPDIEQAHIKLWLSSSAVLDRVVNAASYSFTRMTRAEIEAKVRVYAPNPSFAHSRDKLESHHVVIISGPAGVGKTTLAEMLSYAYLAEGWEFVALRSLEDGFSSIEDSKKQIFFFDDFLGKVALDTKALASKDSDLARFIRRIRGSQNARFVLTTRAYLFEEARRASEHLADPRLDVTKYVLNVGIYTRRVRARILYNHLLVAGTPAIHIQALVDSDGLAKIVDHKNYNPRVIETMTDSLHVQNIDSALYADAFLQVLDNPRELWDKSIRSHILPKCKHLLFALFFCSEYGGTEIAELHLVYNALHARLSQKYGISYDPKDYEDSLKILEGGFIEINSRHVSFINASLRDYLKEYLDDIDLLMEFSASAKKADWAEHVWRHGKKLGLDKNLESDFASTFISIANQFVKLPTWKQVPDSPRSYVVYDLPNSDRIALLLDWWDVTHDIRFADLALALARNPVRGFDAWRDGADLAELIFAVKDGDYYSGFPYAEEVAGALGEGLVSVLDDGISTEDLERVSASIDEYKEAMGDDIIQALKEAVQREFSGLPSVLSDFDSESALDEHMATLVKLAPMGNIGEQTVESAQAKIADRIVELEERTSRAAAPTVTGPRKDADKFTDTELHDLFLTLIQ